MKVYPKETVRRLLATDAVTDATRKALEKRLRETEDYQPQFFDAANFRLLKAICRRLIPQDNVDCAAFIDQSLNAAESDGWRYDALPNDAETFAHGLQGVNETAKIRAGADFLSISDVQQDEVLAAIQKGDAPDETWTKLSGKLFFEELLAKTVEVYYAHPLAQEEIGYVGMADAPGWTKIGLNEREAREPQNINKSW